MRFISLTLNDFGLFHGRHKIALLPRQRRPVILFGGRNGAGKTTILEAIRLCLYGSTSIGYRVSNGGYSKYLDGKIHRNPTALVQSSFASVELEFEFGDATGPQTYSITRSWERKSAKNIAEYFEVKRDGVVLEDVGPSHWQEFVRDLVPEGVSQFFFFDGEKIQELAEDDADEVALRESIAALLGLDLVDRLSADLGIYLSRANKSSPRRKGKDDSEALLGKAESLRQSIKADSAILATVQDADSRCRDKVQRAESELAASGGSIARNRELMIQEKAKLESQIDQLEDTLKVDCQGLLPFALVPDLCRELRDQLLEDEKVTRQQAGKSLIDDFERDVLQKVESAEFWNDHDGIDASLRNSVRVKIQEAIEACQPDSQKGEQTVIHQASENERRMLHHWIDSAVGEITDQAKMIATELESLYGKLHKLEKTLQRVPADEVLRPLFEKLRSAHGELTHAQKGVALKEEGIGMMQAELADLENKYQQFVRRQHEEGGLTAKLRLLPKVQRVLAQYKTALVDKRLAQLEQAVAEAFNTLSRKKNRLLRFRIDPKSFAVHLYDQKDQVIPKAELSAGEKQIYAISMLWALARTSGRPLPMIIDTPLARLDSHHRELLVQKYFPVASHQVLILSTDTEVDQGHFRKLKSSTARSYSLEYDHQNHHTEIREGYFWGEA